MLMLPALVLLAAGCAKKSEANASTNSSTTAVSPAADTGKTMAGMPGMAADSDKSANGSGVPAGYVGLTDKANTSIADAKYTVSDGKWDVQTGPAHIIYAAKDTASGIYAVTATFEQLQKPMHPEAYGVFFGGQNLDDRAKQQYGYFLVRGTGEYLIKARNGASTPTIVDWTASPDVPQQDASGKATYALKVHFAKDAVHFMVNGKLVATVPRAKLPSEGIAGLRINHNLHVSVTPAAIER